MWMLLLSAAMAQTSPFFDVTCSPGGPLAESGSIEVECGVAVYAYEGNPLGTWGTTRWLMGDGTRLEGDSITHTYETEGVFSVRVELEDFEPADFAYELFEVSEFPPNAAVTRLNGIYSICSQPAPKFDIVDKGGLRYDIVNRTPVEQPRCFNEIEWTVRRQGADRALARLDTWEPSFEVPEEGSYVVTVSLTGVTGVGVTDVVLDAEYNLTSDYKRVRATSCNAAPAGSALGLLVLLAVAASRRERR